MVVARYRDAGRIADLALWSSAYVIASLPAFFALALLLRRGVAIPLGMLAFVIVGFACYLAMLWLSNRIGVPA